MFEKRLTRSMEFGRNVARVVEKVEPQAQATLVAAVPVVTVVNPTIGLNLPHLPALGYHFFSVLSVALGLRRRRKPWGVVYDAISKEPISLAIVRLMEVGVPVAGAVGAAASVDGRRLVETQVTDTGGRFGFLPKPGQYALEITKPGYTYPSKIVAGVTDGQYEGVYFGSPVVVSGSDDLIKSSVPLDPVNNRVEEEAALRKGAWAGLWYKLGLVIGRQSSRIIVVGSLVSLIVMIVKPSAINITIFWIYILFGFVQGILEKKRIRPWGVVYNSSSLESVPLAIVNIFDTRYNKLLKTRLTDYEGRFNFLPPAGSYQVTVSKEGYKFPSSARAGAGDKHVRRYYGGGFEVTHKKEVINMDVPVDPE